MADRIKPLPSPALLLPDGAVCCDISIINTTTNIVCATNMLLQPTIHGHERLNLPTYSFYIKNQNTGHDVLFDLGARKDWWNLAPSVREAIAATTPGLHVSKGVDEILIDGGIDLNCIKSIILSHWHWDHIGDPSKFPKQASLVVGPGFKEKFTPGYPKQKDGSLLETDFEGRHIEVVEFSNNFFIGQFRAQDFFSDGSLYLLDAPGHAIGHMCALVRDTASTFIFLGGDITHFGGAFRPSPYIPLPSFIPLSTILDPGLPDPCPCTHFTAFHPFLAKSSSTLSKAETVATARKTPFYSPSTAAGSWYIDPLTAQDSINKLVGLDSNPNILVMLAHDPDSEKYFDFFPFGVLNGWREKETNSDANGMKGGVHWAWVNELPRDGKAGRPLLVNGLWKDGELVL